jgi:ribose transport system substrate-binding protein
MMKRVLFFILVVFLAFGMSVFAEGQKEAPAKQDKDIYITCISKGFQHEFWQTVRLGTEAAAKELGIKTTYEGPANESMIDVQINMIENALTRKCDGLLLAALDAQALVPLVEKVNSAGIPIVMFDSGVNSKIPLSFVATDNLAAGAVAAKELAKLIGGKGKVGIIVHDATSQTGIERRDGFLKEVKASYPNITCLEPVYGGGFHEKSANLIVDMITANPDLVGIFAGNEGSAVGAAIGLQESGKAKSIILVGFDSSEQEIQLLKDGVIKGFVVQNPFNMGYLGVKAVYDAIKGKKINPRIDTGATYVNLENFDKPEIQKLLYPLGKK